MTEPSTPVPPRVYVVERKQYLKVRGAHSADAALEIAETVEDEWSTGEFALFTEYADPNQE